MYVKKGVILLVVFLVVPIVVSQTISDPVAGTVERVNLQCNDGTWYGSCNDKGEICAGGENLIVENVATLEKNKRYVFFGFVEEKCNSYKLVIGDKEIPLSVTFPEGKRRVIADFINYVNLYGMEINVKCDGDDLGVKKGYLGRISNIGLYEDLEICEYKETVEI